MQELWDIYDKDRKKTGRLHRRGEPLAEGDYHLVTHVWVRNREGLFLITKRAHDRAPFPDCWECTGGSALAGETPIDAALRETLEETGLDHTHSKKELKLSYSRDNWHGDVWLFTADFTLDEVRLQKEEAVDARLMSKEQILALYRAGKFCNYDYVEAFLKKI